MNHHRQEPWPDRFKERFHIFALGESFDVDAFLAQSTLRPDFVWKRMGNGPTNGVEFLLGDARTIRLGDQEKAAASYLNEHREDLKALAQFPGVEAVNLGLVYYLKPNVTGCCLGPPNALMYRALEAGVSPRYYVTVLGRGTEAATENT